MEFQEYDNNNEELQRIVLADLKVFETIVADEKDISDESQVILVNLLSKYPMEFARDVGCCLSIVCLCKTDSVGLLRFSHMDLSLPHCGVIAI
jgi:hypothetical protein